VNRSTDVFLLAAAIAYATVLSFFPLLIGLIALVSPFVDPAAAVQIIVRTLAPDLPPGAAGMVRGTLDAAIRARAAAGVLAIAGLLWAASAGAGFLRQGLNRMLDAPESSSFWRHLGTELAMVATAGTLIVLSTLGSAVVTFLGRIPTVVGMAGLLHKSTIGVLAAGLISWILSGAAFVVLYRFLPDRRVRRRSLIVGGLVAMVLFEVAKRLFFWYLLTLGRYPLVYGPLAGVVVFMVWIYLTALITLTGAAVIRRQETGARRGAAA
jgi:membrane protein